MATRRALLTSSAVIPFVSVRTNAQDATPEPNLAGAETQIAITDDTSVVYGNVDGFELLLDVIRPEQQDGPGPAVIMIHGGGWTKGFGDRTMMTWHGQKLARAGYVVFNIAYRLMPLFVWPSQLDDVQRAVRWIRANATTYNVDPERIGSFGYSSGGQLAAFLGVRDTRDNSDSELSDYSSRVQ